MDVLGVGVGYERDLAAGSGIDDGPAGAGAGIDVNVNAPGVGVDAMLKVNLSAGNFFFSPTSISAKAGQDVEVSFGSVEGTHSFTIDGVTNSMIRTGSKVSFQAPTKPGRYPFYCNIANHRQLGMEGVLIVE